MRNFISIATRVFINAIRTVFQTYVEALKKEDKFDEASQKLALLKTCNISVN